MVGHRIHTIEILLLVLFSILGCIQDDDFKIPNTTVEAPPLEGAVISIDALKGAYEQALYQEADDLGLDPNNPFDTNAIEELRSRFTFDLSEYEQFIEGFVISSDEGGNYFEEIVLQDKAENPSAGIRVLIDVNPLFTYYEFGRKLYIKLSGLHIGDSNGVLTLGMSNQLEKIAFSLQEHFIRRSTEVVDIVPLQIDIAEFSESYENLFIQVNGVQFTKDDVITNQVTFAAEAGDQFDGERVLMSCVSNAETILSTSTFADFKALPLPSNQGSLEAVLTRNFFGDAFNLVLNSPEDIYFDQEERCDPDVLVCPESTAAGANTLFYESFQTLLDENELDGTWMNTNINNGSERFMLDSFSGNQYLSISGFNTEEDPIQVWLVTPAINLNTSTAESLSFDIQAAFDNGKILQVFITSNYSGDPTTTEWILLDAHIPTGPSNSFGTFEPSGSINLSCLEGDVHIGFYYGGRDTGDSNARTTRYHIDNIRIRGD